MFLLGRSLQQAEESGHCKHAVVASRDLVPLAVVLNCSKWLIVGSLVEVSEVRDDYMTCQLHCSAKYLRWCRTFLLCHSSCWFDFLFVTRHMLMSVTVVYSLILPGLVMVACGVVWEGDTVPKGTQQWLLFLRNQEIRVHTSHSLF